MKDIVMVKSNSNKSILYLQDGTHEDVNKSLSVVINLLNSPAFFQISRSIYVNLNYLQRLDKKNSSCILTFNNSTIEEPISKTHLSHFEKLNLFPVVRFS